MNLSPKEREFARRLSQFSCSLQALIASNVNFAGTPEKEATAAMDTLLEREFAVTTRSGYKLTQKGRNWLDGPGQLVEPARVTNASSKVSYVPAAWQSVRPGADDHQRYSSKGGRV